MGLWKKLRDFLMTPPLVRWPSDEFQTRHQAMVKLLDEVKDEQYVWALFVSGQDKIGPDVSVVDDFVIVNDGDVIDLVALARAHGEDAIADRLVIPEPAPKHWQHELVDSTSDELATLVDLVFLHHFDLPEDYPLEGYAEW